jgi:hypothetical protein
MNNRIPRLFTILFLLILSINRVKAEMTKLLQGLGIYSRSNQEYLKKGKIIGQSQVSDENQKQKLKLYAAGLHWKNCTETLATISQYENYQKMIDFVQSSSYAQKRLRLVLGHRLLPTDFILMVKIPRIIQPGRYHYLLEKGLFDGLSGTIVVRQLGQRCFYFLDANWKGKDTGYPNLLVQTFTQTLAKKAMETLFFQTKHPRGR